MTDTSAALPGWYPDPADEGQLRAWDGTGWTERVRPIPTREGTEPSEPDDVATSSPSPQPSSVQPRPGTGAAAEGPVGDRRGDAQGRNASPADRWTRRATRGRAGRVPADGGLQKPSGDLEALPTQATEPEQPTITTVGPGSDWLSGRTPARRAGVLAATASGTVDVVAAGGPQTAPSDPEGEARPAAVAVGDVAVPEAPRPASLRKGRGNALVGAVLVAFTLCGLYEVRHGTASSTSDPNRFAVTATGAASSSSDAAPAGAGEAGVGPETGIVAGPPRPLTGMDLVCHGTDSLGGARSAFKFLTATHPGPVVAPLTSFGSALPPVRTPGHPCEEVAFSDRRAPGVSLIAAYASTTDAAQHLGLPPSATAPIILDRYVLDLAPGLTEERLALTSSLERLVLADSPRPATTSTSAPAPKPGG
jgi:Protein of unknown function (DUF2510)